MAEKKPGKKEVDPRVTVVFGSKKGKDKKSTPAYSRVKKSVADFFGLTLAPRATSKGKNGRANRLIRGSVGAGSVKVILASKTKSGSPATKSIPVPSGVSMEQVQKLLSGLKKNKPTHFITKDGLKFDVDGKNTK
jgi:hypothetical protein